jgi:hypothetical protein
VEVERRTLKQLGRDQARARVVPRVGVVDGARLLSPGMLAAATTPQTDGLPR